MLAFFFMLNDKESHKKKEFTHRLSMSRISTLLLMNEEFLINFASFI